MNRVQSLTRDTSRAGCYDQDSASDHGSAQILPDPDLPYKLEVVMDASTADIGAVLLQEGRPIAYNKYHI